MAHAALDRGEEAEPRIALEHRRQLTERGVHSAAALRERVSADAIEGEALVIIGDVRGLELAEQAFAGAQAFASRI